MAPAANAQVYRSSAGRSQTAQAGTPNVTVKLLKLPTGAKRQSVTPDSDGGCVGNLPWNNVQTCISINGGGLHVNYMAADSNVYNYVIVEHVQLVGPSVNDNTPNYVVPPGDYIDLTWSPNANVAADNYCAISWEVTGTGGYSNVGEACAPVSG